MRLWLLGTGTPTPSTRRACSGYLLQVGEDYLVFDHGFGAHQRLLELGFAATQASTVLKHHHYDHIGDYPRLLLTRWDQGAGRIPELEVFGPPGMEAITQRLIADDGAFGPDLISRTRTTRPSLDVYRARAAWAIARGRGPRSTSSRPATLAYRAGWTVRAVAVHHFAPHLVSYGYRLDADGSSFVYSGDTGPCRALQTLAQDCDVLVHMCHYLSGTAPSKVFAAFTMGHDLELVQLAQPALPARLAAQRRSLHVTAQFDRPGMRERVIREIGDIFKGNVIFGEDTMEIPFTSPAAANSIRSGSFRAFLRADEHPALQPASPRRVWSG